MPARLRQPRAALGSRFYFQLPLHRGCSPLLRSPKLLPGGWHCPRGAEPFSHPLPGAFLALQGARRGPDELSSARPSCSQLQIHGTAGGCAGTGTDPAVSPGANPEGGKHHQHPHAWPSHCHQLLSTGSCPRSRPASQSHSQQGAGYGPAQPLCLELERGRVASPSAGMRRGVFANKPGVL